ncbi:hypothetical protein FRB98_000487 [Tulasnella sp. 332]|nr:hypothetical protein FRB98_000487 [Tulasnella sp. 332]
MSPNKENARRTARMSLPVKASRPDIEDLSPRRKARRSLAPRKSILKAREDVSTETTQSINIHTEILSRRVSFAAHAQVRLYTKESNPDGTSSPAPAVQPQLPEGSVSNQTSALAPRKSSLKSRRLSATANRNSVGGDGGGRNGNTAGDWEEGDSSMMEDDDDGGFQPQVFVAGQQSPQSQERGGEQQEQEEEGEEEEEEEEDDDDDMDVTMNYSNPTGPMIHKRKSSVAALRQREPSPAPSAATDASEAMEFTVVLDQPLPLSERASQRASLANDAWAELQALQGPQAVTQAEAEGEDMDVEDAMKRMLAARPELSRIHDDDGAGEDSDMSMDDDYGARGTGHADDDDDRTMDLTSVLKTNFATHLQHEEPPILSDSQDDDFGTNPFLADLPNSSKATHFTATTSFTLPSSSAPTNPEDFLFTPTLTPAEQQEDAAFSITVLPLRLSTASAPADEQAGEEDLSHLRPIEPPRTASQSQLLFSASTSSIPAPPTASPKRPNAPGLSASVAGRPAGPSLLPSRIPSPTKRAVSMEIINAGASPAFPFPAQKRSPRKSVGAGRAGSEPPPSPAPLPNLSFSLFATPNKDKGSTTPSRSKTPSRATTTPTRPAPSPATRKRSAPVDEDPFASPSRAASPTASKKLAVGSSRADQRAISVEPTSSSASSSLLSVPAAQSRETSAPPAMETEEKVDGGSMPPPQARRTSSFALRRANRQTGAGRLSVVPEESGGESLAESRLCGGLGASMRMSVGPSSGSAAVGYGQATAIVESVAFGLPMVSTPEDGERAGPVTGSESVPPSAESLPLPRGGTGLGLGASMRRSVGPSLRDDMPSRRREKSPADAETEAAGGSSQSDAASSQFATDRMSLDRAKVSVSDFLDMAGIRFHENMPVQRRHTIRPDPTMLLDDGTIVPITDEGYEFTTADYYRAFVLDLGQIDLFAFVTSQLKDEMVTLKSQLALLEEEIEENPPDAVLDFLEADAEIRPQIEAALKMAKTYAKRVARRSWYEWKSVWITDSMPPVADEIADLERHLAWTRESRDNLKGPVEELRQKHIELKEQLEKERVVVAEIEACDPEQLDGLMAGIAEQNTAIEGYKNDIKQASAEAERYNLQLKEHQAELYHAQDTIAHSKRRGEILGTTREDVLKCKAWFETIQELHGWKLIKASDEVLEIDHLSTQMRLTLPLKAYRPVENRGISFVPSALDGSGNKLQQFPALTGALSTAGTSCAKEHNLVTHRQIVQHIDVLCTSFGLVFRELRLLWVKHPLQVILTPDGLLHITTTLLIRPKAKPSFKAKVLVDFSLSREAMGHWPAHISATKVEAEVAYGPIHRGDIISVIRNRLTTATVDQHYGILMDACGDVIAKYD